MQPDCTQTHVITVIARHSLFAKAFPAEHGEVTRGLPPLRDQVASGALRGDDETYVSIVPISISCRSSPASISVPSRRRLARRSRLAQLVPSTWHLGASTGRFPPRRFMILSNALKSARAFRLAKNSTTCSGQLFRHGHRHKLIDARTIFFALLLNRLFQRARQPQKICARFRHFPILSIARRGIAPWMPNRSGTVLAFSFIMAYTHVYAKANRAADSS